jgi:hypothetical protein
MRQRLGGGNNSRNKYGSSNLVDATAQEMVANKSLDKSKGFEYDANIRITNTEFAGHKGKSSKPAIPAYFKSFIKKETPARLVDNMRLVTMKRILVDKYNVDFARANYMRTKTPEQKRQENDFALKKHGARVQRVRDRREEEKNVRRHKDEMRS